MDMPTVAIVGRPNVGKSTLFNRLVGKKLALVDDRPGVTRDRREGDVTFGGLQFRVIDTAGLEEADEKTLTGRMRMQTEAAILAADVVLFVIDARAGVLPADQPFAELVRRAGCPVILIANKAEGGAGLAGAYEAFTLGLGDPIPFSAEHGEGLGELHEALVAALPQRDDEEDDDADAPGGRSLKSRSSAGRMPASRPCSTTCSARIGCSSAPRRASPATRSPWIGSGAGGGSSCTTPPACAAAPGSTTSWKSSRSRTGLRAVRFAEVVVVLLDATIPFEKQDLTIVDLVESEGRALVIGLNKWDLVADQPGLLKQLREDCTRLLPQVRGVAVVPLSGLAGDGIDKLMQAVVQASEVWDTRISTSRINDWLNEATSRNPPPAVSGRRIKIRYATQVKSRPPHFALFGNQLNALPKSYTRYLVNGLREAFDLPGTPIRLSLRTSQNPFDKG